MFIQKISRVIYIHREPALNPDFELKYQIEFYDDLSVWAVIYEGP